jgi:hypothetical protein
MYDKPHIYLTMTFIPNWQEIQDMMVPGQTLQNQPDLVARVFRFKLESVKEMLTKTDISGILKANIYVVEFQKRGSPGPCSFHVNVAGPYLSNFLDDH